jgi:hypothetical protein
VPPDPVIASDQPLADAGCIEPRYALKTRTRTSQKISKISGSTVRIKYKVVPNRAGDRCCPSPTAESNLNGRFESPRKNDPAAMNRPKHMRQRCRAMRFAPKTPPPTSAHHGRPGSVPCNCEASAEQHWRRVLTFYLIGTGLAYRPTPGRGNESCRLGCAADYFGARYTHLDEWSKSRE